ncbi:MAG: hypothetical protein F4X14_19585 [Caldilineaceae bacterium SB0661_bin_32]|uniref:Uncharacterized protein n=1 Tax=Caldilineaceae bacterium SB0661_bin_32 TaxID=2605255 RepID=A0A6B1DCE3_9CHLR|nr:hypothetical protein [Caldilineaceae bacterium SB0661_bin_32]
MGISSHFLAYPQESVAYELIEGNAPSKNKRFYLSITSLFSAQVQPERPVFFLRPAQESRQERQLNRSQLSRPVIAVRCGQSAM